MFGSGSGGEAIWGSLGDRTVAVVEAGRVGGECPYVACIPSKAMLRSAQVRRLVGRAHLLGATAGPLSLDDPAAAFAAAVRRRDQLSDRRDDRESAHELAKTGPVLLRGRGQVVGAGRVRVTSGAGSERHIGYGELVIATGSSPAEPAIPGLDAVPRWTSDEALSSAELPRSLVVLGGGPVGCELAQIYAAFGVPVTVIEPSEQLLSNEDRWVGAALARVLAEDGIDIRTGVTVEFAEPADNGIVLHLPDGRDVRAARLITAAGRQPNVAGLGLETLGVEVDASGLTTDPTGRVLGVDHLWAAGDVTAVAPFTHTATYQSGLVAANLRGEGRVADYRAIPRVVYTDPPVAAVGFSEASAREQGLPVAVEEMEMAALARAQTDGFDGGALHLVADMSAGLLAGAAAIGPAADEIVSELSLAIRAGVPLNVLADVVHPFPTYAESLTLLLGRLARRQPTPSR